MILTEAEAKPSSTGADGPKVILFNQLPGEGQYAGSTYWGLVASYPVASALFQEAGLTARASMAAAQDSSKLAVLWGGMIHLLDLQANLTAIHVAPSSAEVTDGPSSLCISPNSCCACCVMEHPLPVPAGAPAAASAGPLLHLWFVTLPDVSPSVSEAGTTPCWKMDAFRLAWAARLGTHPWDAAQRCTTVPAGGAGTLRDSTAREPALAVAALDALDSMFHAYDTLSITS